jgi:hypothetical protein
MVAKVSRTIAFCLLSAAPIALLGLPASAASKFTPPKGCEAYVTVQHSNCQVSYHYTCSGDPKGDQWAVYAGAEGPYYMSRIDSETRWLESYDLIAGESDQMGDETEPASFSDLLKTGRDDYDFTTVSNTGEVRRYKGYDKLAGTSVTIDGVKMEQTEFALRSYAVDGTMLNKRSGQQLINRDWRIFFSDEEDFENGDGEKEHAKDLPVSFAFPGDAGFLSATPQFGCDQMMTDTTTDAQGPIPAAFHQ